MDLPDDKCQMKIEKKERKKIEGLKDCMQDEQQKKQTSKQK